MESAGTLTAWSDLPGVAGWTTIGFGPLCAADAGTTVLASSAAAATRLKQTCVRRTRRCAVGCELMLGFPFAASMRSGKEPSAPHLHQNCTTSATIARPWLSPTFATTTEASPMEDIVAREVTLDTDEKRYFLTWGRVHDAVDRRCWRR
jgi:hypothetical protein